MSRQDLNTGRTSLQDFVYRSPTGQHVGDRIFFLQLTHCRRVWLVQVGIDQHGSLTLLRQGHRQVDGNGRRTDSPLATGNHDQRRRGRRRHQPPGRRARHELS